MLILGLGFLSIFHVLLEIMGVRKNVSRFLVIVPLLFLFSVLAFNRMNNDYGFYQIFFNTQENVEFGYLYLIKILTFFGKDHDTIIFIAGSLLIFTLIKILQESKHVNLVILLYCCFPLVMDINQTRNLIMYLIVILSLTFISKKKPIKYYLGIIVAFSIHSLALVYTPLYYLCMKSRKQFIKIIWTLFIVFIIASPLLISLAKLLFPEKMNFYLTTKPDLGLILMVVYIALDIYTVWWVDKRIKNKVDENESEKLEVFYRFIWFSLLTLPFTAYTFELKRVQRNALLVKFIYCSIAMKYLTTRQRLFTVILLLLSVVLPILIMAYSGELYLFDYFKDNSINYYLDKYIF